MLIADPSACVMTEVTIVPKVGEVGDKFTGSVSQFKPNGSLPRDAFHV